VAVPEEERLLAELLARDQDRLEAQSALSHPQHILLVDAYYQLAKAVDVARGRVDAVRVRLQSLRAAKLRKKDSQDLHRLQSALNALGEEIDTITYAAEAAKEQTPGPEANAAYQARYQRLEAIREKLAELTNVMDSVGSKPRSPRRANAQSDIGEALQQLRSAESNLENVQIHLNIAEGTHPNDQGKIASAKSFATDAKDDLKAAKAALERDPTG
jgi:chromosome segregation ATPase